MEYNLARTEKSLKEKGFSIGFVEYFEPYYRAWNESKSSFAIFSKDLESHSGWMSDNEYEAEVLRNGLIIIHDKKKLQFRMIPKSFRGNCEWFKKSRYHYTEKEDGIIINDKEKHRTKKYQLDMKGNVDWKDDE